MDQVVNIDGEILPADQAKISVFDHGFLYGDSVYETIRTYDRRPFLLDQHMTRLENSAAMMHLRLPLPLSDLRKEIDRTIAATSNPECYIRLIVTRGKGRIGLDIELSQTPSYVILLDGLAPLPADYYEKGVKIAIVSIRRNDAASLNPRMKTSNLLNNILAYREAKEQGAFEGVLCNLAGYVAECTGSNIFAVFKNTLITPPPSAGLLEGVTRALTLQLAVSARIPTAQRNITPDELIESEECFITSTTKEIVPVRTINRTQLPHAPGDVTKRLMKEYRDFVFAGRW